VPLDDAAAVWDYVRRKHLSPEQYRVTPCRPWRLAAAEPASRSALPPLLRGYLRLGAWVCGPPALDLDFGCVDLFVLLSMDRVDERYLKHFLGEAP
jgi:putative hemolysin